MKITKNDILFFHAIICAIWFALVGMVWVYWIALVAAYPIGLISYFIWRSIRKDGLKRNQAIPILLIVGLVLSLGALGLILVFG